MPTNKIKIRIQQYLDGELTPGQKEQVEQLIMNDPAVKKYYDDLVAMDKMLKDDAIKTETINLEENILCNLGHPGIYPREEEPERWFGFIPATPQWTLIPALILGLLIGFFIFSPVLKKKHVLDLSRVDLAGSMTGKTSSAFALPISFSGVNATIKADYLSHDFIRIDFDIQSEQESQIRLSFNKDQFNIWNLKAVNPTDESRILADYRSIEIINRGDNTYMALLKKMNETEEPIKVEVFYNDMLQYQTVVSIK